MHPAAKHQERQEGLRMRRWWQAASLRCKITQMTLQRPLWLQDLYTSEFIWRTPQGEDIPLRRHTVNLPHQLQVFDIVALGLPQRAGRPTTVRIATLRYNVYPHPPPNLCLPGCRHPFSSRLCAPALQQTSSPLTHILFDPRPVGPATIVRATRDNLPFAVSPAASQSAFTNAE